MTIGALLTVPLRQITARYQNKLGLLTYIEPIGSRNAHSKEKEQKEFSPSASRLMPGFATREMSARASDRFRFRIPHQSVLCVSSKEQSFLVLHHPSDSSVEQTIIALVLVAFLLSVPIHRLFRLFFFFFTTYHPIVRPLLHTLRIDRPTRDSRGKNTEEWSRTRQKKKNQQADRSTPSTFSSLFAN